MTLRRRKSRKDRVLAFLGTYLKFKAVTKAVKGLGKVAAKKPAVPVVAGTGVVAVVAAKKLRSGNDAGPHAHVVEEDVHAPIAAPA